MPKTGVERVRQGCGQGRRQAVVLEMRKEESTERSQGWRGSRVLRLGTLLLCYTDQVCPERKQIQRLVRFCGCSPHCLISSPGTTTRGTVKGVENGLCIDREGLGKIQGAHTRGGLMAYKGVTRRRTGSEGAGALSGQHSGC